MPEGIQTCISKYSVDESVSRLETLLKEKGIKLFCLIDHSGEAAAAGLTMPPTKVLIFGNAFTNWFSALYMSRNSSSITSLSAITVSWFRINPD